jgi:hypothetical protein
VLARYGGKFRTVFLGAMTRRYYAFVPGAAAQSVDFPDAAVLLGSIRFQHADPLRSDSDPASRCVNRFESGIRFRRGSSHGAHYGDA